MIYLVLVGGTIIGCVIGSIVYNHIENWKENH